MTTERTALIAERDRRIIAEANVAAVTAKASDDRALIAHLKLQIEKLRRVAARSRTSTRSIA